MRVASSPIRATTVREWLLIGRGQARRPVLQRSAILVLLAIALVSLWPGALTRTEYDKQFRESPNAPVSKQFPLGTDELGRDRFARLLYATRLSLIAAPAAALLSTLLAALVGGLAG